MHRIQRSRYQTQMKQNKNKGKDFQNFLVNQKILIQNQLRKKINNLIRNWGNKIFTNKLNRNSNKWKN